MTPSCPCSSAPRGTRAPLRPESSATTLGTPVRARHDASRGSRGAPARAGRGDPRRRRGGQSKKSAESGTRLADAPRVPLPKRLIVSWNGCGRAVVLQRDRLPVEDDRLDRQREHRLDDLRHALGHVGEVPRERADLVAEPVHLDSRSVELPLDRGRRARPRERALEVLRRLREHRLHRPEHRQAKAVEPLLVAAEGRRRDLLQVAGEHRRPPDLGPRDAGRLRDRVEHHALERALTQLAEQQRPQEPLLPLRRTAEELGDLRLPECLRSLSRHRRDPADRGVHVEELECGLRRRRGQRAQRRPPHSDRALRQLAGEVGDRDRHLLGTQRAEGVGDQRRLPVASGRPGDLLRRSGDLVEQHRRHSSGWPPPADQTSPRSSRGGSTPSSTSRRRFSSSPPP